MGIHYQNIQSLVDNFGVVRHCLNCQAIPTIQAFQAFPFVYKVQYTKFQYH
nr:MAG TPA: hypothetical protein [Caudoviricetes sp.]